MSIDGTPELVLRILDKVINNLEQDVIIIDDPNELRFTNGTLEIIRRARKRLAVALNSDDAQQTLHALRSILGLNKGVIDIGASWTSGSNLTRDQLNDAISLARKAVYGV